MTLPVGAFLVEAAEAFELVFDEKRHCRLVAAVVRDSTLALLDVGERALWAHILGRADAWVLCGPEKASLRLGVRLGFRDRLVALEALFQDAGHRPRTPLKQAYTTAWHGKTLAELVMMEGARRP